MARTVAPKTFFPLVVVIAIILRSVKRRKTKKRMELGYWLPPYFLKEKSNHKSFEEVVMNK